MSAKGAAGALGEKGPRVVDGGELLVRPFAPGAVRPGTANAPAGSARPRVSAVGDADAGFLEGAALETGATVALLTGGRPDVSARAFAAAAAVVAGVGTLAGGGGGPPDVSGRDLPGPLAGPGTSGRPFALGGDPLSASRRPRVLGGDPLGTSGRPRPGGDPLGTSGLPLGGEPLGTSGRPFAPEGTPLGASGRPRALRTETGTSGRPRTLTGTGGGSWRDGTPGGPGAVC